MGEADMDTPRSNADPPLLKAPKDKNCPFCGQAFTSSSLGRHLDLYIRPKNPKAADGIHVVDEIRKLRGGITRRQAKGSISKKREGSQGECTAGHGKHSVGSEGSSTLVHSPDDDHDDGEGGEEGGDGGGDGGDDGLLSIDVGKTRGQFKDVSWGSSGSASNRQLSQLGQRLGTRPPEMQRDHGQREQREQREASRQTRKLELEQRRRGSDERETARAAELALREVLRSVREASVKTTGCGLFDFDPYTLSFPALCLHMLPAPPTLFSSQPFAAAESWSIAPPAQKQLDALNRCVRERLLAHQRQRHINHVYPPAASLSTATSPSAAAAPPLPTPPLFDPDPQKLFNHIADAYNHWQHQSDHARQELWQLEVLRCYARAHDARRDAEAQLEAARREIEYLKASRWATAAPDLSPVTVTLGPDTARELSKQGMDFRNWDFDRLVDKWRAVVRETRSSTSGMAAQKQLPDSRSCSLASAANRPSQSSPMKRDAGMPFSAPATVSGESDHVDAEGDDDDDDLDLDPARLHHDDDTKYQQPHPPLSMPQHHNMPLQPTPIHPAQQLHSMQAPMHVSQAQAHASIQAHAHAHAHAHAQAQAWSAARQHMNLSRNQPYSPHHQQISPHPQHMNSAANSRRPSVVMMDPHVMNSGMTAPMGMPTGMEGIESQDPYLRLDMGPMTGFVGSNDGVSMGS